MVPGDQLSYLQHIQEWADFVILPPRPKEILTRIKRVIDQARPILKDQVNVRDLTINTTTYEVTVNGRRVNLRFKEYELLLLMATNPGRVYTREALLKNIWGFDYLGGTRTVDVHIRRLRSKIEDADHLFIETVWNVGYRFKTA
jgi:DNA-binding response OmpR family regulator